RRDVQLVERQRPAGVVADAVVAEHRHARELETGQAAPVVTGRQQRALDPVADAEQRRGVTVLHQRVRQSIVTRTGYRGSVASSSAFVNSSAAMPYIAAAAARQLPCASMVVSQPGHTRAATRRHPSALACQ